MVMNIWIEKEKYIPYCSYVLDFINHHPLNGGRLFFELCEDRKTANVEYTHSPNIDNPNAIQIPVQNLFFGSAQVNNRALSVNTYHAKPKNVFAIEGGNRGIKPFVRASQGFRVRPSFRAAAFPRDQGQGRPLLLR